MALRTEQDQSKVLKIVWKLPDIVAEELTKQAQAAEVAIQNRVKHQNIVRRFETLLVAACCCARSCLLAAC